MQSFAKWLLILVFVFPLVVLKIAASVAPD